MIKIVYSIIWIIYVFVFWMLLSWVQASIPSSSMADVLVEQAEYNQNFKLNMGWLPNYLLIWQPCTWSVQMLEGVLYISINFDLCLVLSYIRSALVLGYPGKFSLNIFRLISGMLLKWNAWAAAWILAQIFLY